MNQVERTPMRSYEKLALEYMLGLAQEAEGALKTLDKRLKATGAYERLETAARECAEAASAVMRTVPEKQLVAMRRNLDNMEMQIKIKKASSEMEPTGASYVDTALLTDVLKDYASDRCALCLGGAEEQRKCRYKELMDEVVMDHLPEKPYGCKYRDAEWEE